MPTPRVVEIKKPPAKPKIIKQTEPVQDVNAQAEEFSKLLPEDPTAELKKQQLKDAVPHQPPISPLNLDPEVMKKIEEDRKKRRGLIGDMKDTLGLK